MARPIKETPILYGADAVRFVERAERVECLSQEQRTENYRQLKERIAQAKNHIEFCW